MEIRESQIEDILVVSPKLSKNILDLEQEPQLIARQMALPSGRLDLIYSYKSDILLVELKTSNFHKKFIDQILKYKTDLLTFQNKGSFYRGEIFPYLLCVSSTKQQRISATRNGIKCINYKPEYILNYFYQHFKPVASFTDIKPIDIGIWNIHLINPLLYHLKEINKISDLELKLGISPKTLYNKLRFALELRLIEWIPGQDLVKLSEFGREYIDMSNARSMNLLTEGQIEILRKFVMKNPFESSIVLGIASIVEAIFTLSKNNYPVLMKHLLEYFSLHCGKLHDWQTKKAKYNATHMYINYGVCLGLLGKSGDSIFLTPEGFRFTIHMQLHKSIKLLDALPY